MNLILALAFCAAPQDIPWEKSWTDTLRKAKSENKLALLYFHNDGVKDCKRFATETLTKADVAAAIRKYVVCKVDPEGSDDDNRLWQKHKMPPPPIIYVYEPDGTLLATVSRLGAQYVASVLDGTQKAYFDKILPARAALAKNAEDTPSLVALGEAYAMMDNAKASSENFIKALDILVKKGDTKGAIEVIKTQLEIDMETKWYLEARPAVRKLAELDPRDESKLGAKAAWIDGMAACSERKWTDAIGILKPACDKFKDSDILEKMMFTLGSAYMYNNEKDKAIEVFDTIVLKFPESETTRLAAVQAEKLRKK